MLSFIFLGLSLLSPSWSMAVIPCHEDLSKLPTLAGGRIKPLVVHAEESLRFISGQSHLNELSATEVFCRLSFEALGIPSKLEVPIKVEHVQVKELLQLPLDSSSIPHSKLFSFQDELRFTYAGIKENNAYKKEINRVLLRQQTLELIKAGSSWQLAAFSDGRIAWQPLTEFITEEKLQGMTATASSPLLNLIQTSQTNYQQSHGNTYLIEFYYHKWQPFLWALLLSLPALALTFVRKTPHWGVVCSGLVLATELVGLILRVIISGRAPITNMYETVMFSGFGALVLGLVLYLVKQERFFLLGGLAYNCLCLMMMKFANNMLDPSISPLVPVLRDNFWLSTHVTTIILSYGALALSWILANIVLYRQLISKSSSGVLRHEMEQIYTCVKVGVVLLAAGIILGGVWADYSWGRFWGWDPKETWSLIVLLVYMAILHGRYTQWITPARFITLTAAAFMSVMMAWFGVNYILASGLHSYGFSEGGAVFLGSFFMIQTVFLLIATLRRPFGRSNDSEQMN